MDSVNEISYGGLSHEKETIFRTRPLLKENLTDLQIIDLHIFMDANEIGYDSEENIDDLKDRCIEFVNSINDVTLTHAPQDGAGTSTNTPHEGNGITNYEESSTSMNNPHEFPSTPEGFVIPTYTPYEGPGISTQEVTVTTSPLLKQALPSRQTSFKCPWRPRKRKYTTPRCVVCLGDRAEWCFANCGHVGCCNLCKIELSRARTYHVNVIELNDASSIVIRVPAKCPLCRSVCRFQRISYVSI